MIEFTLRQTTTAPIEKVFDSLTNHRAIADVSMARRSTLDREGVPAPNGVGAVRRIEAVGPAIVEEIIEYERPTRYAYKMLSGAPVRDHVGTVSLREAGTGTEVEWHLRSTPKIPGVSWLLAPVLKKVIGDLLGGAVKAAERS
ncbi:SRPBCC family protein [Candidatus Mycobacterium wuenschmannii]|uniref:SRPBCC family protein n=1 Tax=Candidatus Mycobacterium wuenschmannii TaxID=3027808 RepID=A0ABY8VWJ1_9MYCO|nr:SRPBCC family protein [Candidatus Mycobacterium wuenschmannii]WIM87306.1 SRPBCC family protein [Candidatus Mycobacterium wuenschmannii]